MLKNRIIPCLDIKDGRTVKGVNFNHLKDAGDPIALAKKYVDDHADELVFLDISASIEKRKTLVPLVKKIAKHINIPFTVGGGINELESAEEIIKSGADKICLNTAAVNTPTLINKIAQTFGRQAVVVAIDIKKIENQWFVYTYGGTKKTDLNPINWARKVENLGAGELLITAMDKDGTKEGFEVDYLKKISSQVNIPVIASGGAGKQVHFKQIFANTNVTGALAASVFHFEEIKIPQLKTYLKTEKIPIR